MGAFPEADKGQIRILTCRAGPGPNQTSDLGLPRCTQGSIGQIRILTCRAGPGLCMPGPEPGPGSAPWTEICRPAGRATYLGPRCRARSRFRSRHAEPGPSPTSQNSDLADRPLCAPGQPQVRSLIWAGPGPTSQNSDLALVCLWERPQVNTPGSASGTETGLCMPGPGPGPGSAPWTEICRPAGLCTEICSRTGLCSPGLPRCRPNQNSDLSGQARPKSEF